MLVEAAVWAGVLVLLGTSVNCLAVEEMWLGGCLTPVGLASVLWWSVKGITAVLGALSLGEVVGELVLLLIGLGWRYGLRGVVVSWSPGVGVMVDRGSS